MLVSGNDLLVDSCEQRFAKLLLLGSGDARRKRFQRRGKRTALARLGSDVVCLGGDFLEKISRRHQAVQHALAHVRHHLTEQARDLVQARDVVAVVGDRIEWS